MKEEAHMNVEQYLQLKYGPNEGFLKTLRAGVIFMFGVVVGGLLFNLSLGFWTLYHALTRLPGF